MKFHLISLGCTKNTVDSEKLIQRLSGAGLTWCPTEAEADLIFINTCGFIKDAKEESLARIMAVLRHKTTNPALKVVAFGCLVKRYHQELIAGIPELDFLIDFAGEKEVTALLRQIGLPKSTGATVRGAQQKRVLTPRHFSYLKISEGCDNRCAYCAIPLIRGHFRSVPRQALLQEAKALAQGGVKELIVVAQDTTRYGTDLPGNGDLADLLADLSALEAFPWIRLQYLHPKRLNEEFLDRLFSIPRVLPYFDIPFQHVSDRILQAMNRGVTRDHLEHLLQWIRGRFPDAVVRSTFIVGFPGETEEEFEELTGFLDEHPIDRVGAFAFSPEEDTTAARLKPRIRKHVKTRRLDELMTLQQVICLERNKKLEGKAVEVIVDEVGPELAIGRSRGDAPEVDNLIRIRYHKPLHPGDIVRVRITGTDAYDLDGELIS